MHARISVGSLICALWLCACVWVPIARYGLHGVSIIPEQYRHRGFLWFTSQLTAYLMRPNALMAQSIEVIKRTMHFDEYMYVRVCMHAW
jgi:hypothetical protein